ncbi:MAG: hypothetical protein Kow002_20610 [Anaerolineales bacterium]
MKKVELPKPIQCNTCQAGMMRVHYITYFTWLNEELITVPNFPAWICDVCGRREYDERAISWLTMLLSPSAGTPTQRKKTHNLHPQQKTNQSRPQPE